MNARNLCIEARRGWLAVTAVLTISAALTGCGGGGGVPAAPGGGGGPAAGSTGPDRSPDFALKMERSPDDVLNGILPAAEPGGTVSVPLYLYSENGWPNAVQIQINGVPTGWTVTTDKTSFPNLPAGKTPLVATFKSPANAKPGDSAQVHIAAVSGSVFRAVNGGGVYDPKNGGNVAATTTGVVLPQYEPGTSPFFPVNWGTDDTVKSFFTISGQGVAGPVTLAIEGNKPGLNVTLNKTTIAATNGKVNDTVEVTANTTSALGLDAHALTLKATEANGKVSQSTFYVNVIGIDAPFPATININKAAGSTGATAFDATIGNAGPSDIQVTFPDPPEGISLAATPSAIHIPAETGKATAHVVITATATKALTPGFHIASLVYTFPSGRTTTYTFGIQVN